MKHKFEFKPVSDLENQYDIHDNSENLTYNFRCNFFSYL